ncbi:Trk system potassium transporter TrkA [Methylomonas sp. MED-D]|uniref:Trk system potassium uptake protein TrkA n=1 Tax=Methylomonas koyamae TaxID=702114 RepID=A0A177N1S1_9GAMM|nr:MULTISPECIES: Trk system potassium transporter TrkA [Methylomonas]NJA07939.1 Trk system potassium transporter TrkA [Methylococcaceae bacterium WWC4]MDT4329245.1 Trk system potassium transporter TrkA [Methylomonas sp. MV1]OAI11160.1 potassium transporter peripheral membrane component [Methylomonas koyamae]OHX36826.1 Trk system potassium transport protein TrkA [Methylomonas sp. LWB]WGS87555.1 Trk system potassium transporter TrkA [Methylomonas sp. UP202]
MKIVILGAGVTGSSVAGALASEENDIVVIDQKSHLLTALKARLDIATVEGNATHPSVLEQSGIRDADMVIAVTDRDETNMLACQVINTLYSKPKTIARVRAIDFLTHPELFQPNGIPIDIVISPEQVVTEAIRNLIKFPGALHVSEFADGLVRLFSIKVVATGFLTGKRIQAVKEKLADGMIRVAAIFRDGKAIPVNGEAVIATGDEVFFVCPRDKVRKTLIDLHKLESPIKSIMLAGGGHIGKRLALALENNYHVKVIEHNIERAKDIANDLRNTMILHGDCTDESLLLEEMIEDTDLFCAITNNDGINLISAGLAKKLGAKKAICLVNNNSYLKLLDGSDIDLAIQPKLETLGGILKHVRKGDVVGVSSVCGGSAEAIEAIAHRSKNASSVVGLRVDQVNLPDGVILGALIREKEVIPVHHDTVFAEGDHVVMFALNKKHVKDIEEYFQPI